MRRFDALKRNSVESKQPARARHPEIAVARLRERNGAAQRRTLARAPSRVVQFLDGQIRTERDDAAAPEQRSDREPPFLPANEESLIHRVIVALDPFRRSRARREYDRFRWRSGFKWLSQTTIARSNFPCLPAPASIVDFFAASLSFALRLYFVAQTTPVRRAEAPERKPNIFIELHRPIGAPHRDNITDEDVREAQSMAVATDAREDRRQLASRRRPRMVVGLLRERIVISVGQSE